MEEILNNTQLRPQNSAFASNNSTTKNQEKADSEQTSNLMPTDTNKPLGYEESETPSVNVDLSDNSKNIAFNESKPNDLISQSSSYQLMSPISTLYEKIQSLSLPLFSNPLPKTTLESQNLYLKGSDTIAQASTFSFDLQLQTKDGDVVTIKIARSSSHLLSQSFSNQKHSQSLKSQTTNLSGYEVSVMGKLDEQELKSLAQFLEKISSFTDAVLAFDLDQVLSGIDTLALPPQLSELGVDLF